MKSKSYIFVILLIFAVFVSACNDKKVDGIDKNKSANNNEQLEGYFVSDEKIDIKIHFHDSDRHAFKDNWPVFQKAEELTNAHLIGTAPSSATNSDEVFHLMVASQDLPDIIHGQKNNLNKLALDGGLEPLDNLIEEYAPNIKKFFEENPWAKAGSIASDGKLYYIPYVMEGEASMGWFFREDWLDKLGLEPPKTLDEFYDVLIAFKKNDPNGNGKEDEIPFFSRSTGGINYLLPLFGVRPEWHVVNGEVKFGKYTPEYKEAMINIAKWYKEGLIDKEIFTRGSNARDILFDNNTGGITMDWFPSTASYNDRMQDTIENFSFVPILPPADINGDVWHEYGRQLLLPKGWGIASTSNLNIEIIKYFDFWFSPEGRRLINFGIEGEQYDLIDGDPIFKDSILNGDEPVNEQLWKIGAQLEIGTHQDNFYEVQWTNPIAQKGIDSYIESDFFAEQFPSLSFTPEEEKIVTQKLSSLETFMEESQQRWILGAEDIEGSYDNYLGQLENMGMNEVLDIYQAAYVRYQEVMNE